MDVTKLNKRAGKETKVFRLRRLGEPDASNFRQVVIKKMEEGEIRFCIVTSHVLNNLQGLAGYQWLDPKDSGLAVCQVIYKRAGENGLLEQVEAGFDRANDFF